MNIYYVDGNFVRADQAVIPVDDLAIVRGIGVFDLLRTYNGKPLFLKEHVARLLNSARQIKLDLPWSHEEICRTALETLSRNHLAEANIRIIATGGSSPDFATPQGRPRLLVLITPLPELPSWWYEKGVKVVTLRAERRIPGAKSIDYLAAGMALRLAHERNAVEAIYVDSLGHAREGTSSNLFAMLDGRLTTPGEGILAGITRQVVLETARELFPIEIRHLPATELLGAQEVFLSGTNKGVVPVVQIDDTLIGDGHPGAATRRIMAALEARIAGLS
jgi:branched-chain amino acid aminotransferase